ncbi:MAG: hypothetical protein AAFY78_18380 [Cyanobacteria bacterium J06648_16]
MPADIRAQAFQLVETLPQKQLSDAVRFLELLSRLDTYVPETDRERQLVSIIQRRLSDPERQRLNSLRDRNQQGSPSLTKTEYTELIALEDRLEVLAADRLEALIQLADLTHLELASLNQQLKAAPPNSHAIEPGASNNTDQTSRPD